ncbi:MAG: D-sedoheptulose 7-phosphate isomerase [Elusimicrobiaceae bacterium]|mgnify:FL=1|jgi:D-sedoheptulose 7-phosphate isomerase|nr:D-sedoheptulose 7-phosphate isomerase [Elusimicrobiaceae bacterium]MBT3954727.1 D-sedoheptulose 7-phosphate isomerase [Elusimicrobiaceae bacterium]MBT4008319.1 D-sedoheptulose 7-phosphate isomerase [Elusimicrobiaceae bacterium]MBT4402455.1 D-sedoheptulose 7-phosphate isomerase [Elusimicrobiaceae bacterium]MBT4439387.1 D-sedoheptulose 7-phosphate isomerase [Elusimicrobiaceae bacterium]
MNNFKEYTKELIETLNWVSENLQEPVNQLAEKITKTLKAGGKVILMGNGGSAGDAQHIAAELVGRYKKERKAYPAIALNTNTSTITAVGNDYGYEHIFSRQVEAFANKGDIVIGISTSGNSKNVYLALEKAKQMGCLAVGLLGKDGGTIKNITDLNLIVKTNNTPRVQECHILIGHSVCEIVEENL